MFAKLDSFSIHGVDAVPVIVEVDSANGLPSVQMAGLGDSAVKESKHRVLSAVKNSKFKVPPARITINLAPADLKKEGSFYDLPIALALLLATKQIENTLKGHYLVMGELALNGLLRRVSGTLSAAMLAREKGYDGVIVPRDNVSEAALVPDINVIGVDSLAEAAELISGQIHIDGVPHRIPAPKPSVYTTDFEDIKSQEAAKRALSIAAAGGHNILLIGPPGCGKTMMARALPGILPSMTIDEMLEVTRIYSVAGMTTPEAPLINSRPFRCPHHTISEAGLIGGGSNPSPGEVSLAHNGVLFLDELTEFNTRALESLRQPLEDKHVTIARVKGTASFPSRLMLVAAMNPGPDYYAGGGPPAGASAAELKRYWGKVSQPLLDRIDIQLEVPAVSKEDLTGATKGESSQSIRDRVNAARERQRQRFTDENTVSNADMAPKSLRQHCQLNQNCHGVLDDAFDAMGFSARSYDKIVRVARTIADLEQSDTIEEHHLLEAVQYRCLDRQFQTH